ncbi:MAG TPA: hypothetical protein VK659_08430 [Asanoa sp.]|nr:hypothetical protein [Asanoa sp.]
MSQKQIPEIPAVLRPFLIPIGTFALTLGVHILTGTVDERRAELATLDAACRVRRAELAGAEPDPADVEREHQGAEGTEPAPVRPAVRRLARAAATAAVMLGTAATMGALLRRHMIATAPAPYPEGGPDHAGAGPPPSSVPLVDEQEHGGPSDRGEDQAGRENSANGAHAGESTAGAGAGEPARCLYASVGCAERGQPRWGDLEWALHANGCAFRPAGHAVRA